MIFDVEDETRDFETNYRAEYYLKNITKSFKANLFAPDNIDDNPLTDPYKRYLYTESKNKRLPAYKRSESAGNYLTKVRSEHLHLIKVLPKDPPNETVVVKQEKKLLRSVYQIEIAKTLDNREQDQRIELPKSYSVPETIQKISYRDPRRYGANNLLNATSKTRIPNNLVINEKEREILRVRTGDTEYQDVIGKVGHRIMDEQFFGPPIPLDPPENIVNDPDSIRSMCSKILKNVSNRSF